MSHLVTWRNYLVHQVNHVIHPPIHSLNAICNKWMTQLNNNTTHKVKDKNAPTKIRLNHLHKWPVEQPSGINHSPATIRDQLTKTHHCAMGLIPIPKQTSAWNINQPNPALKITVSFHFLQRVSFTSSSLNQPSPTLKTTPFKTRTSKSISFFLYMQNFI